LSEVSASTLRLAHAEHPITALQTEYSLWTRNPEIAVLDACRELGVGFVAFSPVARGFLSDQALDVNAFDAKDIRRAMPRFTSLTYDANLALLNEVKAVAQEVNASVAQVGLAWLLAKGVQRGQAVIPIPGTTNPQHLEENLAAADCVLNTGQLARLETALAPERIVGGRYNALNQAEVDTEEYTERQRP